jgi:TolB protein
MKILQRVLTIIGIIVSVGRGEKVHLESYATSPDSILIGILPFSTQSGPIGQSVEPGTIIGDDLNFSEKFLVINAQTGDSLIFSQSNAALYIAGRYDLKKGQIRVDCFLRDAHTHEQLVGRQYSGEIKLIRTMMHAFSNEMIGLLFNAPGIFLSKMLFVKDMGNIKNIMIMDYDGFNQRQIISNKSINVFPAFIDSTAFVWTSFQRGHPDIFKASIATGISVALVSSRFNQTSPSVSPIDGETVFASDRNGNMQLYVCDADGSGLRRLTFNEAIDISPCWSPDGYHIAFISDREGSPQIYFMDKDGDNTRRLTYQGNYQDSPAWSPRGDKIAYMSMGGGVFDIWTIGPDGSNPTQVTSGPGSKENPAWSPDGSYIAFSNHINDKTDIYAIRPDGTHLKKITDTGNAKMPDWSHF